ncbi:MAG TPA: DUF2207 domain-containing protein [Propionibacteriaceae bacterium]|nr:DUF2207 domain-containing protein [Propionibacteriaceae bacterium]
MFESEQYRPQVRRASRSRTWLALVAGALALLAGPHAVPAYAEGNASTVVVAGNLAKDGTLKVTETITFTGTAPGQVTQTFETRENLVGNRQYEQQISAVTASAEGAGLTPVVTTDDRTTTVTVPTNGAPVVVINYTVTGAVVTIPDGTALRWRLLQGLSAQVNEFSGTVQIPGPFSYVKCTSGSPNSTTPCDFAAAGTEGSQTPTFRDGPRGEGEVVAIDVGFPPGAVIANETITEQWTLGRAFSAEPLPLALALGSLVLGGLGLLALHRRAGRDTHPGGELHRAGEFAPTGPGESEFRVVGDVRPGHVGTVVDERVDPIDVTATLLDLAVRGHLLITELPRPTAFAPTDWTLRRLPGPTTEPLRPFEQQLLDGLAPVGGEIRVAELAGRLSETIDEVQDRLYDEMVSSGWYERRPDAIRNRWTQLGLGALIAAAVVAVLLVAFSTLGLLGLVLVALALGLVFVGQEMPSRTAKGSALLAGLGALRSDLLSQPTDQMPRGRELHELSEVLPYAVVLGGADRWLHAIVANDDDHTPDSQDLPWYHGPADWHLSDLPDSLRNFITTVSGNLFSR